MEFKDRPDGKLCWSTVEMPQLAIVSKVGYLRSLLQLHHLVGHQHKITAVRFCGSGEAIVTASADRSLKVWDISRTTYKQLVTLRHGSTANCVDVGSDSFSAVSGHLDGGLRCWDLRTGDRSSDFTGELDSLVDHCLYKSEMRSLYLSCCWCNA